MIISEIMSVNGSHVRHQDDIINLNEVQEPNIKGPYLMGGKFVYLQLKEMQYFTSQAPCYISCN